HLPQPIHHATAETDHLPVFGRRRRRIVVRRDRMGVVGDHVLLLLLLRRPISYGRGQPSCGSGNFKSHAATTNPRVSVNFGGSWRNGGAEKRVRAPVRSGNKRLV